MQLGRIYLDMVNVYKVLSENISSAVAVSGKLCSVVLHVYTYIYIYIWLLLSTSVSYQESHIGLSSEVNDFQNLDLGAYKLGKCAMQF